MARAAVTGIRLGPLVKLLHLHGCGAGSVAGTGSAAGWLLQSPWVVRSYRWSVRWVVRSCPCLSVCSLAQSDRQPRLASDRAALVTRSLGVPVVPLAAPSSRGGVATRAPRLAQPGSALKVSTCQIDATRSCRQVAPQTESNTERKPPLPGGGTSVPNNPELQRIRPRGYRAESNVLIFTRAPT